VPNNEQPEWDELREHPGFVARRSRIGRQLGTERVGVSLWELPPGQKAYPYHLHLGEEEVLVVLAGTPTLRTPEGERVLAQGEVVRFPPGEDGAHQLRNATDAAVRFLAVSSHGVPDVVLYPDSGKVGAFARTPDGSGFSGMFRAGDAVDYHHGEA